MIILNSYNISVLYTVHVLTYLKNGFKVKKVKEMDTGSGSDFL